MPLYEYHCRPCDHTFEALVRNGAEEVRCPKCDRAEVARQLSVPAATPTGTLGYSPVSAPGLGMGGCGQPGCGPGGCAMN